MFPECLGQRDRGDEHPNPSHEISADMRLVTCDIV
jgi:hypothetical protein